MPTLSTQPNRAYPNIPEITEDPVTHTIALQAIKGALQTHERRDNNFLKSFIRFEELVDLGIIDEAGELVLTTPGTDSGGGDVDPVVPPVTVPTLDELLDVTAPTPIDDDILGFDFSSGLWINQTAAELNLSEIGHTHTVNISLDDLTDVNLTGANNFDLLFRTGSIWTPTNQQLQWDGSDLYIATGDLRFSPIGDTVNSAIRPNLPTPGDLTIQALAGDLFLHPVLDVVLDGLTNLVIESDQAIRWFDQLGAKQTMLEFVPEVAGSGAAVGHVIAKLEAGVSTTSGTYVDVTGAKVDYASMEANEDYAVFVRAYIGNSSSPSTPVNGIQLTKGGTLVTGSDMLYESPSTIIDDYGQLYCWGGVINSGASGDLQMRIKSGNGSDTVFANNVTIMMIKVDDLIFNTNIFHDTDTSLIDVAGGGGYQGTGAAVTIGDGSSDWLVFGSVRLEDYSIGGSTPAIRVNDGTSQQSGAVITKGDNSDELSYGFMQLWQGVASSTTLTVEADGGNWTVDKTYASIIAIRLNALEDYNVDFAASSGNVGDGPTDICTVAFTTSGAADYGFISGATGPHAGNQGAPDYIRLDVNGGGDTTIAGSETQFGAANVAPLVKNIHWAVSADQSLGLGDTVDADFHAPDGITAEEWFDCFLVAFQWALAGGIDEFFDVGNVDYITRMKGLSTRFYDVGLTDYVEFEQDGADFNISGFQTANINITDITSIQAGTVDVDFDDITATSYGAIPEANLVDKQAVETIEEVWTFEAGNLAFETGVSNPSHAETLLFYDDTVKALSYYNEEADVTVNVGQENLVRVRNATGSTITDGQLVYISGQIGNRPTVSLAKADAIATSYVLGMATHDIEHNSDGYITTLGTVNDLDTSGATEGAQLYLSEATAGAYTETAPTGATEFVIPVGFIMTANVSTGRIYVSVAAAFPHAAALSTYGGGVAADDDMLYRTGGSWEDTNGALTWDGSALATTGIVSLPGGAVGAPSLAFTGDLDTGIFSPGANIFAITAGGTEAVRYTGASAHLVDYSMNNSVTASTTQTQGQEPLTASYNNISIVANNDDVVTLPTCAIGRFCLVVNSGVKRLQVFPASGDDLGVGVDTSDTIKANTSLLFMGITDTVWHDVATKLESLQGIDISGAADGDLLYRSNAEWIDTAGALTWDGSALETTGIVSLAAGTEGAPALTFTGQLNTGLFSPGEHIIAISCGGTEAIRWTGSSPPLIDFAMVTGITASTTQTQGQQPLTCSFNTITVVANDDDVVTLPPARIGRHCHIINVGANRLQVFPASGQNSGHGTDVPITVKADSTIFFVGLSDTVWHDQNAHLHDIQDVDLDGIADGDMLVQSGDLMVGTAGNLSFDGANLVVSGTVTGSNLNVSDWDTAYGWGDHAGAGYVDGAGAITAVENEASLTFQQPTVISTKSGAGTITLKSTGNTVILEAGTDIRLKSDTLLFDNKKFWIGTSKDYWFDYSTSGSRLRYWTKDGDGGGTDMVWMRILDGTIDPQFPGAIEVDTLNEYTADAGVTIEGVVLKDSMMGLGVDPAFALDVHHEDSDRVAAFVDTTDQAIGTGGGIGLGGWFDDAKTSVALGAGIEVEKVSAVSGEYDFDLVFLTQSVVGGFEEVLRLTYDNDAVFVGNITAANLSISDWNTAYGWGDHAVAGYEPATKEVFVPAGSAILAANAYFQTDHVDLPDGVSSATCWFTFRIPNDFNSQDSGYPKVVFTQGTGGTGNFRVSFMAYATATGEQVGDTTDSIAEYSMAAPGGNAELWEEDISAAFNGLGLNAGDYISLRIIRDSDDGADTFAGDLDVMGIVLRYS